MKKKKTKTATNPGIPKVKLFRLDAIHPAEYNPRIIDDENLAGLEKSISQFGCIEPIVVNVRDGRNVIVGGHQRFAILKKKKVKECLCVVVDFDEKKEKTLNFVLNNPEIQGQFIKNIDKYIKKLQKEIGDERELLDMLDLKIKKLEEDIDDQEKSLPAAAYAVICDCETEAEQKEVYDMLTEKGHKCKLTTL